MSGNDAASATHDESVRRQPLDSSHQLDYYQKEFQVKGRSCTRLLARGVYECLRLTGMNTVLFVEYEAQVRCVTRTLD